VIDEILPGPGRDHEQRLAGAVTAASLGMRRPTGSSSSSPTSIAAIRSTGRKACGATIRHVDGPQSLASSSISSTVSRAFSSASLTV
jgi:hypothetical protein